jgi:hypothetical protein
MITVLVTFPWGTSQIYDNIDGSKRSIGEYLMLHEQMGNTIEILGYRP